MQNHIINYNCDIDSIEELNGYTIEHAEGCTDASAEGFSITAYREISGVKVYREFSRNDGVYYISGEYIPDMEKKQMKE